MVNASNLLAKQNVYLVYFIYSVSLNPLSGDPMKPPRVNLVDVKQFYVIYTQ